MWSEGMDGDELGQTWGQEVAEEYGVLSGSLASSMLDHWLQSRPTSTLGDVWKRYVRALFEQLSKPAREFFRDEIHRRLDDVANASGGVLMIHRKSEVEEHTIEDLMEVFDELVDDVPETVD